MKEVFLASELLGKCGVFWSQLVAKKEDFNLNCVMKTYRDIATSAGNVK